MDKSKNNTEKKSVPDQYVGKHTGAQHDVTIDSVEGAKKFFQESKKRFLDINNWDKYAGIGSADFKLTDDKGSLIDRMPKEGDYIRINLPGPGPTAGDGFDWVRIELIEEKTTDNSEYILMKTRPAQQPDSEKEEVAHFYTEAASSNFILQREGNIVSAAEKGRNEVPNDEEPNILDRLRNAVVSFTASRGAAYPQWKALTKGFLENK